MPPASSTATLPAQADAVRLTDSFRLDRRPEAVSQARRHVGSLLERWGIDGDAQDAAVLVVSELVTNAVVHTDSYDIACQVTADSSHVRIEVRDHGDGWRGPRPQAPCVERECGRGLALVEHMAASWGVFPTPGGVGRTVWATLRTATTP